MHLLQSLFFSLLCLLLLLPSFPPPQYIKRYSLQIMSVLLLGSGLVSAPVVSYLYAHPSVKTIVIGNNNIQETLSLIGSREGISAVEVDAVKGLESVTPLIAAAEVVVSLLPATLHVNIAKICISLKKNMVTASYVSPAMKDLHQSAVDSGIVILNELGLDPGIDHMSARSMVDRAHREGYSVESFFSVCGGLPSPDNCTTNPFKYKFSWNPRGVLTAGMNDATYLVDGEPKSVAGISLLESAKDISIDDFSADLQHIPNRNSLNYIEAYNIQEARSVYRGTLRYKGYCEIMAIFRLLGLFDAEEIPGGISTPSMEYSSCLHFMMSHTSSSSESEVKVNIRKMLLERSSTVTEAAIEHALVAMEFIGLLSAVKPFPLQASIIDSICDLLKEHLVYREGERDVIVLKHQITVKNNTSGARHCQDSTLIVYGDEKGTTAMSKTVGLPVAIAASLILQGKLLEKKGVVIPIEEFIYEPILVELQREGIHCVEREHSL